MPTRKISISVDDHELAWAKKRAKKRGVSLSSVVTGALHDMRTLEARREVLVWLFEKQPRPTESELEEIKDEWD